MGLKDVAEKVGLIRPEKRPVVYGVEPFDLLCRSDGEVEALASAATSFVAGREGNFRLLAYTHPVDPKDMLEHVREQARSTPEQWKREQIAAYGRAIRKVAQDAVLQQVAYYFLTWDNGSTNQLAEASQLAYAFANTPVRIVDEMPSLLSGDYIPRPRYLEPLSPEDDYVAFIQSHDFHGGLYFGSVASAVLRRPYPVGYAVDVKTISREQALTEFPLKKQKGDNMLQMNINTAAQATLEALRNAEWDVREMGWTVHRVSIAVAVKAPTVEKLEERVQEVLGVLRRNQVMARRADAHQEEVYRKFFTADPAFDDAVIDDGYHSMVSKGPAMLAPYGHYVRDKFEGVMFGIARSGYPVFVDRWGLQSYNQVVTGKTGSGKTFAVMDHALRGTLMADEQWVIIDPQGNAGQMTKALSGSYNRLSLTEGTSINILDVVEETLAAQNSYVLSLLETLWGEELTMQQKGVLDDALTAIYAQLDDDTRPEDMPTLETLIEMVEGDLPDFAAGMHRSVRGSLAGIFNRPTNIDLQMEAPIITYDLQDIPDEFEHLFTYMLLRSIERWLRRRRRRRRVGIIVDELGVLCRLHPAIQSAVTVLFKRIRNYNAGVVAMDQNITTFAEMPDVLENAKVKIFFGAETETEADRIQQMFRLTDYYRNVLLNAQRGEGVLLLGRREMHHIHVVPTGREFQLLARQPKGDEWVLWG